MNNFIEKYEKHIDGVISGFDRLVFHGHLRTISGGRGMKHYLDMNQVLLKQYGQHVQSVSERLKDASLSECRTLNRPVVYVRSSAQSKEDLAREIARRDGIRQGLIGVLTALEPCWTFRIYSQQQRHRLKLEPCLRKCLHLYHYWMDPELGFMSARIQTWFPFAIQVCMNGREWLARQMDAERLKYVRQDNCFVWLADYSRAQTLLTAQLEKNWPEWLNRIAQQLNPIHEEIFSRYQTYYYWSTYQSEWATDIVFRNADVLQKLYPAWTQQAITTFSSPDVMRFLGRSIPLDGSIPRKFAGVIRSDRKERQEGVRIKHSFNGNSVKAYDKARTVIRNVLRVEATVNRVEGFKVYRPKQGGPEEELSWRPLRRGVADLHRRAELSHKINERYLNALASLDDSSTLEQVIGCLEQPVRWKGRRVRGLHLWQSDDHRLLTTIARGEFVLQGLRNRDLQPFLFRDPPDSAKQARQRSARVSRLLAILRAHGLLQKLPKTHRYQVTTMGRTVLTAILAASHATIAQLTKAA